MKKIIQFFLGFLGFGLLYLNYFTEPPVKKDPTKWEKLSAAEKNMADMGMGAGW